MSKILKLYYFPKAGNTGKDTISQIYMLKQFKYSRNKTTENS